MTNADHVPHLCPTCGRGIACGTHSCHECRALVAAVTALLDEATRPEETK